MVCCGRIRECGGDSTQAIAFCRPITSIRYLNGTNRAGFQKKKKERVRERVNDADRKTMKQGKIEK